MRPLRLVVKGFTSFRDQQELDFRGLEVFAIAGPTGSGKSSILDAMTYALFGEVDRVGVQCSQLVSHGLPRMAVTFDFRVGREDYRITRSTPREGPSRVLLERLVGGTPQSYGEGADKVREARQLVVQLLGLDFDAFVRSILLPQGKFAEFLTGDARKRRDILSDLLGLRLFDRLAKRAGSWSREAGAKADGQRIIVEREYANVTSASVESARHAAVTAREGAHALGRAKDKIEAALAQSNSLDVTLRDLSDVEAELRDSHSRAERATARLHDASRELDKALKRLERATTRVTESGHTADALRKQFNSRRDEWGDVADVASARSRAESLARVRLKREQLAEKIALIHREWSALRSAVKTRSVALQDAERTYENAASRADEIEKLREARHQLERLPAIRRRVQSVRVALETKKRRLAAARSEQDRLAKQSLSLEAKVGASRDALAAADEKVHGAEQTDHVAALTAGLNVGSPCPVCGRRLAALPSLSDQSIASLREQLTEARRVAEAAWEDLTNTRIRMEACKGQVSALEEGISRDSADLAEAEAESRAVSGAVLPLVGDTSDYAAEVDRRIAKLTDILERSHQALVEARMSLHTAETEAQAAEKEVDRLRRDLDLLTDEVSQLEHQVREAAGNSDDPLELLSTRLEELTRLKSEVDRATAEHVAAQNELHAVDAARVTASTDALSAAAALQLEPTIINRLERLNLASAGMAERPTSTEVASMMNWGERLVDWLEHRVTETSARARSVRAERDTRTESLLAFGYEFGVRAESPAELVKAVGEKETMQRDEAARLEQQASTEAERLAIRLRIESEIGDLIARDAVMSALALELRADRITSFLQGQALRSLTRAATAHLLVLTESRYELVCQEHDEFFVVDKWYADELRAVRTLSGGETFLVALSLALALSEQVQTLAVTEHARMDSLFLDEGFGTLDPQTLQTATQAVQQLAGNGRLIGVITHIREFTDQFTHVEVEKTATGSHIHVPRAPWGRVQTSPVVSTGLGSGLRSTAAAQ